jgi:hypothetical protein
MEFFASHDLPLCFLPCHSWRYQQHPALSATVLRMFSRCAAPALSLTSSSGKLLAIRTKNTESVRFCSQDTRGTERVKCRHAGDEWAEKLEQRLAGVMGKDSPGDRRCEKSTQMLEVEN